MTNNVATVLPEGWCGDRFDHDPHVFTSHFQCDGIRDQTVTVQHVRNFSDLVAFADSLRRTFAGIIVETDECVVITSFPDLDAWKGGRMTILGLGFSTASHIADVLHREFVFPDDEEPEIRNVTADEAVRVVKHRAGLKR